jgi:hypothetical protein
MTASCSACGANPASPEAVYCELPGCPQSNDARLSILAPENAPMRAFRDWFEADLTRAFPHPPHRKSPVIESPSDVLPCVGRAEIGGVA